MTCAGRGGARVRLPYVAPARMQARILGDADRFGSSFKPTLPVRPLTYQPTCVDLEGNLLLNCSAAGTSGRQPSVVVVHNATGRRQLTVTR